MGESSSAGDAAGVNSTGWGRNTDGLRTRLLEFIRRRVSNDADAEDILQDVFAQMVAGEDEGEPIGNLTAWLFTAARNRIIDWYRRRKHAPLPQDPDDLSEPGAVEDLLFDHSQSPEVSLMRSLLWDELMGALEELPEEQRDVFVMNEIEGFKFREIAEMTGVPLNTLLSRKRYAVLGLRRRLRDLYEELQDL